MLKISDAEKIKGTKKRIREFSSEASGEKTLSNSFKLLEKTV